MVAESGQLIVIDWGFAIGRDEGYSKESKGGESRRPTLPEQSLMVPTACCNCWLEARRGLLRRSLSCTRISA